MVKLPVRNAFYHNACCFLEVWEELCIKLHVCPPYWIQCSVCTLEFTVFQQDKTKVRCTVCPNLAAGRPILVKKKKSKQRVNNATHDDMECLLRFSFWSRVREWLWCFGWLMSLLQHGWNKCSTTWKQPWALLVCRQWQPSYIASVVQPCAHHMVTCVLPCGVSYCFGNAHTVNDTY